jgi:hypothetical protein
LVWTRDGLLVLGEDVGCCRVSGCQGGGCWIKLVLGICWRRRCGRERIHTFGLAHRAVIAETTCRMWRRGSQALFSSETRGRRAKGHTSASLDSTVGVVGLGGADVSQR